MNLQKTVNTKTNKTRYYMTANGRTMRIKSWLYNKLTDEAERISAMVTRCDGHLIRHYKSIHGTKRWSK